jgi:Phage integrase, N-terminal SAM-like domain
MANSPKTNYRLPVDEDSPKYWFSLCAHQWEPLDENRAEDEIVLIRDRWQLVRRLQERHVPPGHVPPVVSRLGRRTEDYATALLNLSRQGSEAAELALTELGRQAEQVTTLDVRAAQVLRLHYYSIHTERSYLDWIKRYVRFHRMRCREDLADGERKIEAFFTDLAARRKVAASTQNQAMNALVFLYRKVLDKPLDEVIDAVRAERKIMCRWG